MAVRLVFFFSQFVRSTFALLSSSRLCRAKLLAAFVLLACRSADALTADNYWQHDPANPGDWFEASNWTGGAPGESDTIWIDNGGTANIDGGVAEGNAVLLSGDSNGGLKLSAGAAVFGEGLYVVGNEGSSPHFEMTGGTLTATYFLSVGSRGTPLITHSGGTATTDRVRVGVRYVDDGTYELSGSAELISRESIVGGDWGSGEFLQQGGTHRVAESLIMGYASSAHGRYVLQDGTLATGATFVGERSPADFEQSGGEFSAGYLSVNASSHAIFRGGTLSTLDSAHIQGTLDFDGGHAVVSVAGIADFGSATITGGQSAELNLASDSLIIVPAGFDPAVELGTFSNQGLVHHAGQDLVIPHGATVKGFGTLTDHVQSSGSLLQQATYQGGSLELTEGVMVDSNATVRLGAGSKLTVRNQKSGISSGELQVDFMWLGHNSQGQFVQSGGAVTIDREAMFGHGNSVPSTATYLMSGGSLSVEGNMSVGHYRSVGLFEQEEGEVTVGGVLAVGTSYDGATGTYRISGGVLSANRLFVANSIYADGLLEIIGGQAAITADEFGVSDRGVMNSRVNASGLSEIAVNGSAALMGQWHVIDEGAPTGRWNVLTAAGGIATDFDVTLPGVNWSWGIDNGSTLWVQRVPEPSGIMLMCFAALALRGFRRC